MASSNERPARVLLGITGGIAAYKTPSLVRRLIEAGCDVQVIMTEAASSFVTPMSLATVSRRPVRSSLLDVGEEGQIGHIQLADWADLVVVAPATANVVAHAATGLADDLLTTCLLATRAPILFAPAMNTNMWRHPATQFNLAILRERGGRFVGPDAGELACGWIGEGRMIDPELIVDAVRALLDERGQRDRSWDGRRVLVSAGPTRTYLDPVRFLTNASTGAMGFAMAELAAARGAEVWLVSGPLERATPVGVRRVHVETADEMLDAMDELSRTQSLDLVAMVAAVSDVAAARPRTDKLPKTELMKELADGAFVQGVDVLATLVERYRGRTFFLGFGAQTIASDALDVEDALRELGTEKLLSKGCDALFVNRVGTSETGFGTSTNAGLLLVRNTAGQVVMFPAMQPVPKRTLAGWILDQLSDVVSQRATP